MKEDVERALNRLREKIMFGMRRCYQSVFMPDGGSKEAERVLADLRDFCMAQRTTFDPDPQMAAFRAGKREVWLRIQYFLNLEDAEVRKLVEVKSDYVED